MPSTRPSAARGPALPRGSAGRVVLALALVGLVLFMHALTMVAGGAHAVRAGAHEGVVHVASVVAATGHEMLSTDPAAEAVPASASVPSPAQSPTPGPAPGHAGAHGAVTLMCLAVLALTALLVLRPGSGRGWWSTRPGLVRRDLVVALVRSRGPAPPDLHQLSILRC